MRKKLNNQKYRLNRNQCIDKNKLLIKIFKKISKIKNQIKFKKIKLKIISR